MKKVLFFMIFFLAFLSVAFANGYLIGDGDTLQISVWGEPELSAVTIVRPDGKITLPAVGDVMASGYKPRELAGKLTEDLRKIVKEPIVTVTVTGITNNKVYVFGGGVPSGVHNLPGRTSLLRFLCRLGSFKSADLERAYIVREGKKLDVNFYNLFVKGDLSKDVMLKAEDIIYIPDNELNKIYVIGAVNEPKYVFYRENIRILDAILEAGGFTKFAKENDVLVLRKKAGQTETIVVKTKDLMKEGDIKENIALEPGDFVIVKEGIF
ncbi:FIG123464: Polysaccharide export protein [hydrothermal vent metagenome]|uniref:FIG123464: Polysaccharide export protein n=1 Tax=hydrothermal vent metagenome TaxID=652676 RepID=A0A3B1DII3_9ZZZZ